jgi:hypothetical protein
MDLYRFDLTPFRLMFNAAQMEGDKERRHQLFRVINGTLDWISCHPRPEEIYPGIILPTPERFQ